MTFASRPLGRIVGFAISPGAFFILGLVASPPARAQFANRTTTAGLTWMDLSWAGALGDVDGDGDLDVYAGHHYHQPVVFWNDGSGHFDMSTHIQPWQGAVDRHGVLLCSLDADADPELFIQHGGQGGGGMEASELYRNDGGGALISLLSGGNMLDPVGRGRCASAADYDRDGRVDVWVGQAPGTSPNRLYRNDSPLFFHDVGASVGLDENQGTAGGIWGDFDDDGDEDLLVGGEEFPRPTILWRNDGSTFSDASSAFSPPVPVLSGADWGDFDNDGDLDLAAANGQIGIFDAIRVENPVVYFFNTRYFENGVDGLTIISVSDTAHAVLRIRGVADSSKVFLGPSAVAADSSVITLSNALVGAPTFDPGVDRGTWVWRASPGGDWEIRCSTPIIGLDVFDGLIFQETLTPGVTAHDLEDPNFVSGGAHVWRNDGGSFVEISSALGLPATLVNPRDISWVDFDNDGDLDLHVVDKGTSAAGNAPDRIYRNDGSTFLDVTSAEGLAGSTAGLGDGGLWGDVDGDGDLDLYLLEGAGPESFSAQGPAVYYENQGPRGPSIELDLVGRESGSAPVGTRVTAVVGANRVYRRVQANAWQGLQDPMRIHIGLNGASTADSILVEWTSGGTDVYVNLPAGIWALNEGLNPTSVPPNALSTPDAWGVSNPVPQPARRTQTLYVNAERPLSLSVTIHDVAGRLVRHLLDRTVEAGTTEIRWDGRDDRGRFVPAGVYFVRATDGRTEIARRSTRLR